MEICRFLLDMDPGSWVSIQQQECCKFTKAKKCSFRIMTSDRYKKLLSIRFVFKRATSWEDRFQELLDYKKTHGYMQVPFRYGPLGSWVSK
jgi:hypothetical protein